MALADKKYEDLFDKTGSGKKRMTDLFGPLPDPHKGHNHK